MVLGVCLLTAIKYSKNKLRIMSILHVFFKCLLVITAISRDSRGQLSLVRWIHWGPASYKKHEKRHRFVLIPMDIQGGLSQNGCQQATKSTKGTTTIGRAVKICFLEYLFNYCFRPFRCHFHIYYVCIDLPDDTFWQIVVLMPACYTYNI